MTSNNELFSLKDKTIMLTGSAGRLGTRFAHVLSGAGANLILVDIDKTSNKKLERELILRYKTKTTAFSVDISKQGEVKQLVKKNNVKICKN